MFVDVAKFWYSRARYQTTLDIISTIPLCNVTDWPTTTLCRWCDGRARTLLSSWGWDVPFIQTAMQRSHAMPWKWRSWKIGGWPAGWEGTCLMSCSSLNVRGKWLHPRGDDDDWSGRAILELEKRHWFTHNRSCAGIHEILKALSRQYVISKIFFLNLKCWFAKCTIPEFF